MKVSVSLRRRLFFLTLVGEALFMTVCTALSLQHEVTLLGDKSTRPVQLERARDGGFLVALHAKPATLIKLRADGSTQWVFEERVAGAGIRSATSDTRSGIIVCVTRKEVPQFTRELPSVVVRLDDNGHELARLDSGSAKISGGPFYAVAGCLPWGDGYAVIASEKKPIDQPDDQGEMPGWPLRSVVMRLRSDFSVQWRKPLSVHASPIAGNVGPRILPNGDLIIVGSDRMFRLDGNGIVKAQVDIPICTWLRTESQDNRIRLACGRLNPPTASTIVEYDNSLSVISRLALGDKDVGLAKVCELSDGKFALLGTDGQKGPFVQLYSRAGAPLAKYKFEHPFPEFSSEGGVWDGVPIALSAVVVLRNIDRDWSKTVVTWLNTK